MCKISVLAILVILSILSCNSNNKYRKNIEEASFLYNDTLPGIIPENGFVPDKATAIKIAEAIWLPIYGKRQIDDEKPFIVELKDSNTWVVEGTLKSSKGGVAYIEIQKSDCKILKVFHGK